MFFDKRHVFHFNKILTKPNVGIIRSFFGEKMINICRKKLSIWIPAGACPVEKRGRYDEERIDHLTLPATRGPSLSPASGGEGIGNTTSRIG
jgi:hypothetical protein